MWLTNLQIVLPEGVIETGSLRLEGELIAEVLEGDVSGGLDCGGLTAIPGIVDVHGDMLERELQPRPGSHFPFELALHELDKRLVSNGITTAYAAISFIEGWKYRGPEEGLAIIHQIHRYRHTLLSELRVHARFEVTTPSAAPILREAVGQGEIHLVSLMDHSPGQGQFRDLEQYVAYYRKWIGASPEQDEQIRARAAKLRDAPSAWPIAQEVCAVAQASGVPLASHDDDTAKKVALMSGLGVSISEFPVSLEAAAEAKQRGMWVVMGAPNAFRGGSHSGNLSALEGIQAGLVDGLAADYHPSSLLQSAFKLAAEGVLPLERAVGLVSQNPAAMTGLHDRGRLEAGLRADLALVEVGSYARVRATLRAGRLVYSDGALGLPSRNVLPG
jgi:alpha-D-ribose 1-methylphosphonate 5-triphosphate diphosphatase